MRNENLARLLLIGSFALFCSFGFTACGGEDNEVQPNPGRLTSISGSIETGNADSVSIYRYDLASLGERQLVMTEAVENVGNFDVSWTAVNASRYELAIDERTIWWGMYLEPGDDVKARVFGQNDDTQIEFDGDNASFQQYLYDSQKAFGPASQLNQERMQVVNGANSELFENWATKSKAQREEFLASFNQSNPFDERFMEYAQGQIAYSVEAERARYFLNKSRAERSGESEADGVAYSIDPVLLENRPTFQAMSEYVNFITAYSQRIQEGYMASLVSMNLEVDLEEWLAIEIDNLNLSTEGMGQSGVEVATADFIKQRIVKAATSDDFGTCLELIDHYVETSPEDTYHTHLHESLVAKRRTLNF